MLSVLHDMFPEEEILEEYVHPTLRFSESGVQMTFDAYIPSMNMAFEYQGMLR